MPAQEPSHRKIDIVILALILAVGIFLRLPPTAFSGSANPLHAVEFLHPKPKIEALGFDEGLYAEYVNKLTTLGLSAYPFIVQDYLDRQERLQRSVLPPLRFLYIFSGYVWHVSFGTDALNALRGVASLFSILTLLISTAFAWRLKGKNWALAVAAFMCVAPTQIHMSQHAMVDGFFTFWALLCLWMLWENLRTARSWPLLIAYILALALLVLTKENSFFVWVAIVVLIVANRWLQFGTVTREVVAATLLGPLFGVVILALLAGGISEMIHTYHASVVWNYKLYYAVLTGDGPWYRYLVDLLLVSPVVLILALGSLFRLDRTEKPELYMSIFIAASYLVMCNIKYGMNLRYTNMWDMPLRFLAFSFLVTLFAPIRRYRNALLGIVIAIICALELRQYIILAVQFPLYELISEGLLRALHILKSP
jgi:4-amino-4-deoxy-L-arabinose transferase-like glycosyltransferase